MEKCHTGSKIIEHDQSAGNSVNSAFVMRTVRYEEFQRNHAQDIGGYAVDGCREFIPFTEEEFTCAACGCHQNFHLRVVEVEWVSEYSSSTSNDTSMS